jgi:hypothetical protein
MIWTGDLDAVRAFARQTCDYAFPADWIDEDEDGSLILMCDDSTVIIRRGEPISASLFTPTETPTPEAQ